MILLLSTSPYQFSFEIFNHLIAILFLFILFLNIIISVFLYILSLSMIYKFSFPDYVVMKNLGCHLPLVCHFLLTFVIIFITYHLFSLIMDIILKSIFLLVSIYLIFLIYIRFKFDWYFRDKISHFISDFPLPFQNLHLFQKITHF